MPHHTITLNYDEAGFRPNTEVLPVKEGDTISFQLGVAPPNSTFKITMKDPEFFSAGNVTDSNTRITVIRAASTTYQCQLFDSDHHLLVESGKSHPGGGVRPDSSA